MYRFYILKSTDCVVFIQMNAVYSLCETNIW